MDTQHKTKVLHILPSLMSGSVEKGTVQIINSLSAKGYKNFICSRGGDLTIDVENHGSIHFDLPLHRKNPFIITLNIVRLIYFILNNKVQILHARTRLTAFIAWVAARLTRAKLVTNFHLPHYMDNAIRRFYNSFMLKGDKVFVPSEYVRDYIQRNYTNDKLIDKITIINRGVDTNYFDPDSVSEERKEALRQFLGLAEEKRKIILLPSRFVRWKGHLFVLNCLRYLKSSNYLCLMVGSMHDQHLDYIKEINTKIKDYKLLDRVMLKSAVIDMPALYSLVDIVLAPSAKPESFGRVIIEAQAMKKPVVAIRHGDTTFTIANRKNGFYIPLQDYQKSASILKKILEMNNEELEGIGNCARKLVLDNFSLEKKCEKIIEAYQELTVK